MRQRNALILTAALCLVAGTAINAVANEPPAMQTPQLFVTLPDFCPTPDAFAIDREGNLIVSCPNFSDTSKPGCIIKIDTEGNVRKWFNVPTRPETGRASPMGMAFGPDGELFIADNQPWLGADEGQFKGRIIGCRVEGMGDDAVVTYRVIADGIEHPNGIRYHNGMLYLTVSMLTKIEDRSGLLVSGVYRFDPRSETTVHVTNTKADPNLILTVLTYNRHIQYGLDGIDFRPGCGTMYLSNFGDGSILRVEMNEAREVISIETWARDPKTLRTADGIVFDAKGNLYIADFSDNAIAVVRPNGRMYRIAQSPDSDGSNGELDQPGEPVVWNGRLIVSNFDAVIDPERHLNSAHQPPHTLSMLELVE